MFGSRTTRIRRARLVPIALTTAALSSAVLGVSATGTLSAYTASITNTTNTAVAGSLVMQEQDSTGSTTCLSSSGANNSYTNCAGINKYGGTTGTRLWPGGSVTTTVSIANLGTANVRGFTVDPGTCTKTNSAATGTMTTSSLCDSAHLTLTCAPVSGTTVGTAVKVYDNIALSALTKVDLYPLSQTCVPLSNSGNTVQMSFTVSLPSGQDNTVQGQTVSQPIVWTFTGA